MNARRREAILHNVATITPSNHNRGFGNVDHKGRRAAAIQPNNITKPNRRLAIEPELFGALDQPHTESPSPIRALDPKQ